MASKALRQAYARHIAKGTFTETQMSLAAFVATEGKRSRSEDDDDGGDAPPPKRGKSEPLTDDEKKQVAAALDLFLERSVAGDRFDARDIMKTWLAGEAEIFLKLRELIHTKETAVRSHLNSLCGAPPAGSRIAAVLAQNRGAGDYVLLHTLECGVCNEPIWGGKDAAAGNAEVHELILVPCLHRGICSRVDGLGIGTPCKEVARKDGVCWVCRTPVVDIVDAARIFERRPQRGANPVAKKDKKKKERPASPVAGEYNIFVQDIDHPKVNLRVTAATTIEQVKERVKDYLVIPVRLQALIFKGQELNNPNATLGECGIVAESNVYCVDMHWTTAATGSFLVLVELPGGTAIYVRVKNDETVGRLYSRVATYTDIPVRQLQLTFKNRLLADGNATVTDAGMSPGSAVYLTQVPDVAPAAGYTIYVQSLGGPKITLHVTANTTVQEVKVRVKAETDMPVSLQQLVFKGKSLDDANATLGDSGIVAESALFLNDLRLGGVAVQGSIVVEVKLSTGRTINLRVDPNTTIRLVHERIEGHTNIPARQQQLYFNDRLLDDANATVRDCGIVNGSIVKLSGVF